MSKFYDEYKSLSEVYNSILCGNEIEFRYNGKCYYMLPHYNDNKVIGVCFGEAYSENEIICLSKKEVYNATIESEILGEIISQVEIIWKNF